MLQDLQLIGPLLSNKPFDHPAYKLLLFEPEIFQQSGYYAFRGWGNRYVNDLSLCHKPRVPR